MLGGFLEGLAVFAAQKSYGAKGKSSTTGLDIELDQDGVRYFVAAKSGPSWGNSSQIAKMQLDFKKAAIVYRQNQNALPVQFVNGCAYGKLSKKSEDKGRLFETLRPAVLGVHFRGCGALRENC